MSDLIKRDDALHIVDTAEDEHPYKIPGLFFTYSEYNQGWSDAVDFIRSRIEKVDSVPAAPCWVRCEEPPKESCKVIVRCICNSTGQTDVTTAYFRKKYNRFHMTGNRSHWRVTHWMWPWDKPQEEDADADN